VSHNLVTPAGQFDTVLKLGLEECEAPKSERKSTSEHNNLYIWSGIGWMYTLWQWKLK